MAPTDVVWQFARKHLGNIPRRSGESYAEHGREVRAVLLEITPDESLQRIAMLHDLLVHPDGEELLDKSPLEEEERALVRRMHALRRLHINASNADLDRVVEAFTADERLLPLRLAHRLNDVRHLERFSKTLQRQIARETLHMYTGIAGRVSMNAWRYEMEERCFANLRPKLTEQIAARYKRNEQADTLCLKRSASLITQALKAQGMSCTISSRIKGCYSTYRKMLLKKRRFEDLTDRLALRVVVASIDDCYRALGVIHQRFHPIPGKLKDYIGAPKENGYRSIHTVVYPLAGITSLPVEIQIRTPDMQWQCDYGTSKHGEYKNAAYALQSSGSRVNLFKNLVLLRDEAQTPAQFERLLRTYFRPDYAVIFDEHGGSHHVKKPLTALDFACLELAERVGQLREIRRNGQVCRPGTPLHDGDTVALRCGRKTNIGPEWPDACVYPRHRRWLKNQLKQRGEK